MGTDTEAKARWPIKSLTQRRLSSLVAQRTVFCLRSPVNQVTELSVALRLDVSVRADIG